MVGVRKRGGQGMHEKRLILDHGYLLLVEHWGSDERIVEAARMSTGKGFLGWGPVLKCVHCGDQFDGPERPCPNNPGAKPLVDAGRGGHRFQDVPGDEKLLAYLWGNKHHTPFEMPGLTVEVQAPIMVFREWHRHRVPFGYNEMSARYTPLPDVNYVPTVERLLANSKTNKQAGVIKGADELTEQQAMRFRMELEDMYQQQERLYQWALQAGVPKELARVHLPVGRYSRMRATGNLRGWLGFLALRMAPATQYEIRQYANAVGDLIAQLFPRTWRLFVGE
jgi:thymidylate synthase (FAD)